MKTLRRHSLRAIYYGLLALLCVVVFIFARGFFLAELVAPKPTVLLLDRHQQFLAELSEDAERGHGFWPLLEVPERVANAILVLEDKRFWQHHGVDWAAVSRALWQNFRSGERISGASTIAMQVARMQNPNPRNYYYKSVEAATAIWLTLRYSREEIMAHYLRIVPYGNQIHGIAYAAERYFDKPANDLSWAEIALLSAIPQSPTYNNPLKVAGRERANARALRSLKELYDSELISLDQYELAVDQIPRLHFPRPKPRPDYALHGIFKLQELLAEEKQLTHYRVQTSLSLSLQQQLAQLANGHLSRWQQAGAENVAAVVIDNRTREVLAWLGSANYFDEAGGAIDYAQVARSPGSALKPFIYALALERGDITAATLLPDVQALARGVSNSDHRFLGPLLPRQALANSRNVPAIHLVRTVGIEETFLYLRQLALHDETTAANFYGAGMAVGTLPTSLEKLVQAYAMLANDGKWLPLRWYQTQTEEKPQALLSAAVSRQISHFLSDPVARLPTFPRMGTTEYDYPVAVKTGTSQGYRDAWTLAYSRDYTVGVWVGRSDAQPMRELGGAGSAAPLAQAIFAKLYNEQKPFLVDSTFLAPEGYESVALCAYTGKLASALCPKTTVEWLANNSVEREKDFSQWWVDKRNGLLAGEWTPAAVREQRVFLNLPFIYQQWGMTQGLSKPPVRYSPLNYPLAKGPLPKVLLEGPQTLDDEVPQITIVSPKDNAQVAKIPHLPASLNTLSFSVDVKSHPQTPVEQVLWYVDGKPFKLLGPPFTLRWPLTEGEHEVVAELPYYGVRSNTLRVLVE